MSAGANAGQSEHKTGNHLDRLAYEVAAKDAAWPVLPVVMADMQTGEIIYASKFCADIFGYTPEEMFGKPVETLVSEDVRPAHAKWRTDAAAPKTRLMGVGRQVQGRRKDGSLFPVHVGLTAMKAMGREVGIAFVIDLTGIIQQASDSGVLRGRGEEKAEEAARKLAIDHGHGEEYKP